MKKKNVGNEIKIELLFKDRMVETKELKFGTHVRVNKSDNCETQSVKKKIFQITNI